MHVALSRVLLPVHTFSFQTVENSWQCKEYVTWASIDHMKSNCRAACWVALLEGVRGSKSGISLHKMAEYTTNDSLELAKMYRGSSCQFQQSCVSPPMFGPVSNNERAGWDLQINFASSASITYGFEKNWFKLFGEFYELRCWVQWVTIYVCPWGNGILKTEGMKTVVR